ncbi:MAG: HAD family hydrolase [Nitrososphaerota archaeon]|nr:HAD family hydrolase [Nitrososphaerota archaeon]MDG7052032.1 HAD family hydrolase [Nitrososphaerota archaeon]
MDHGQELMRIGPELIPTFRRIISEIIDKKEIAGFNVSTSGISINTPMRSLSHMLLDAHSGLISINSEVKLNVQGEPMFFVDLDGTIIDNVYADGIFPEYISELRKSGLDEAKLYDLIWTEHRRLLCSSLPESFDWEGILKGLAHKLNVDLGIELKYIQEKYYQEPFIRTLNGAPELLKALNELGPVYVSTNGFMKYQRPVLKALGLDVYFKDILTPDRSGYIKSDKRFYGNLIDDGHIAVNIGDDYLYDVLSPKLLGSLAIWAYAMARLPRRSIMMLPDLMVSRLQDIPRLIRTS